MAPPSSLVINPDAQECAILLVFLVQAKEGELGRAPRASASPRSP